MRIRRVLRSVVLALVCVHGPVARACGPDFPEELLSDRSNSLLEGPIGTFAVAILKLVPTAGDRFRAVEGEGDLEEDRTKAEVGGLDHLPDAARRIARMREESDAEAAYIAGEGLPEAVRQYTAGAVGFRRAVPPRGREETPDDTPPSPEETAPVLREARARFEAVLALAPDAGRLRAVWAAYMLARIAAEEGNLLLADEHFGRARALARAGAPDPLGLAAASFGEQALGHLQAGDVPQAVALYLEQAACDSNSAVNSLKRVARKALKDTALLNAVVTDAQTRGVLFLYSFTHGIPEPDLPVGEDEEEEASGANMASGDEQAPPHADAGPEHDVDVLHRLADALDHADVAEARGADWLAAAAYRAGRFDLAGRLASRDGSALAHWIQGKLALRRGDRSAALAAYAEAKRLFPPDIKRCAAALEEEPDNEFDSRFNVHRVEAERGILRLAQGEYVLALTHLYAAASKYWIDAAYVAERVFSLDELWRFVDERVPPPTSTEVAAAIETGQSPPAMRLRALLARRLMRGGRIEDAIGYFDDEDLRDLAQEYRVAVRTASSRWRRPVIRAAAWFTAGSIARFEGMELLGFEGAPDYAVRSGAYGDIYAELYGVVEPETADSGDQDEEGDVQPDTETDDTADAGTDSDGAGGSPETYETEDERARFEATRAEPDTRFQYRVTAAQQAVKAADLLPRSSQAFATVLCHATRWLLDRDPDAAHALYLRYIREGPYVPWGKYFGHRCPVPDFSRAELRLWAERVESVRLRARAHPVLLAAAVVGLLAAAAWGGGARSRQRMPR